VASLVVLLARLVFSRSPGTRQFASHVHRGNIPKEARRCALTALQEKLISMAIRQHHVETVWRFKTSL
jgi:hypothetical protein